MKNIILNLLIVFSIMVLVGCGGSSKPAEDKKTSIGGVAQKGPFLSGGVAKIFKLDTNYERTSTKMETTVGDNGVYSFANIPWSGLSEIEVSGRFLNENTGIDTQTATITSVVEVTNGAVNTTNINVLTHMASAQVKKLLKEGKTLEEANEEVVRDVFNILGRTDLGIGDFGDLDLADLLGSSATANSELLFLSAALLKSNDYMADLEALLALYKDGGIDAILGSDIYAKLMEVRQGLDEATIIANVAPEATEGQIRVISMVLITKSILSDIIEVRLFGTKFISTTPSINLTVDGGTVTKGDIVVSDDNKSATIAISGDIGACQDVFVGVIIDPNSLEDVTDSLSSNIINMHPIRIICQNSDNGDVLTPILSPNRPPVAIIGMSDNAQNNQQAPQSITVSVGAVVSGLDTYYSYDQDPYPDGGITHCKWEDEDNEVIKSSSNKECGIYDKVFDTAGEYIYTLTVTDNREATNSNTVTITAVEANPSDEFPVAKIGESSTTVNQEIYAGNAPHMMIGGTDDDGIIYCKWQDITGAPLHTYSISPAVQNLNLHYEECSYKFPILNTAGNYIYTFMIRDTAGQEDTVDLNVTVLANATPTANIGANRTIEVGDTLAIAAVVNDSDDDNMTYQWMYGVKDSGSLTGAGSSLNFSHQFNDVGLYEIIFRVADAHSAFSLVKIDVNVTEVSQDLTDIVTIESLMWEDTTHARTGTVVDWKASDDYCIALDLGGFEDWRLANAIELQGIMDSNNTTQKAIVDGFVQFNADDGVTSWTSNENGAEHIVGLFTGGNNNLDGFGDTRSDVGVRCVRDK